MSTDHNTLNDASIRAFQRTTTGALFAACTRATEGNDAERRAARLVVAAAIPAVLVNEDHKHTWRQYLVITAGRVACVEMVPALLLGWKFHRVWVQTAEHAGYSRDAIVRNYRHCEYVPTYATGFSLVPHGSLGDFEVKLLAVAASGRLPEGK